MKFWSVKKCENLKTNLWRSEKLLQIFNIAQPTFTFVFQYCLDKTILKYKSEPVCFMSIVN